MKALSESTYCSVTDVPDSLPLPHPAGPVSLRVFDNNADVGPGEPVPDPVLVLEMAAGRLVFPRPRDAAALGRTPDWAKPLVEAAISNNR